MSATTISKGTKNAELVKSLKMKFCAHRYLNMNHRHIKYLSNLFIRLFQENFINANDTHRLVNALVKFEEQKRLCHEAQECLSILNSYHKLVGFQPIPQVESAEATFKSK